MPLIKCETCGKEFNKDNDQIKRSKTHFCSKECRIAGRIKPNEIIVLEDYAIIKINSKKYGNKEAFISIEDIEKVKDYTWKLNKCSRNTREVFYVMTMERKTFANKSLHRFITGEKNPKLHIDHINHNTLDNRRENLRVCTNKENQRNRIKYTNTRSGRVGVSWHKSLNKWSAYIKNDGKHISLGVFENLEDAIQAREQAEFKYWTSQKLFDKGILDKEAVKEALVGNT